MALVTYFAHGHTIHALVWGAHDALQPNPAHPRSQVKFHVNYAGGYGSSLGTGYWRHVVKHNVCGPYAGPSSTGRCSVHAAERLELGPADLAAARCRTTAGRRARPSRRGTCG